MTTHQIINDDFRNVKIEDNSIDLILTDPPYPKEYLPLWKDLSVFANQVLKPSGFLLTYSGEMYLPEVINNLKSNLIYYWCFALVHSGNTQIVNGRNIICGWKPLLLFQKPPFKMLTTFPMDTISGMGREKNLHKWQQSSMELGIILEKLTNGNDVVLDPFAGSGSTMELCKQYNRNSISIDIDPQNVENMKKREVKYLQQIKFI